MVCRLGTICRSPRPTVCMNIWGIVLSRKE